MTYRKFKTPLMTLVWFHTQQLQLRRDIRQTRLLRTEQKISVNRKWARVFAESVVMLIILLFFSLMTPFQ